MAKKHRHITHNDNSRDYHRDDDNREVVERDYNDNEDRGTGFGWLPLLLIPLFLLGAFLLWPRNNSNNKTDDQTAYVQPTNTQSNGSIGPAVGVGGAPASSQVSPTTSQYATPSDTMTPSQGPQVGVGGGPSNGSLAQTNPTGTTTNDMNNSTTNSVPSTSPHTGHGAY